MFIRVIEFFDPIFHVEEHANSFIVNRETLKENKLSFMILLHLMILKIFIID